MDTEEVFVTVPLMVMGVLGSPVGGLTEVIVTLTNSAAVRAWAGEDPAKTVVRTINNPSSQAAGRRREAGDTFVMVVGRGRD
ncbi:DNA-binding protein [Cutibacterium avidum]|uniref:DNA-binding protein n=1 Tax=Cutibacterium avidum TaxID=33010 RepID=UPI0015CF5F09|nr:DNA-binding protein [Cutibacterium avidum]MBS6330578.1 DNA-binding protein [Propionibacterium sp.]MCO6633537.1 DNA-binding protein [Cutibacterium avidum]MCO6673578.1 DNA-binding protein [Cutibacterium avidum]MCO6676051.1 DNA-binding protein [Cutibacterium avidum]MCO6678868.1 DNA-binding protein [Cutibacterium avidum]